MDYAPVGGLDFSSPFAIDSVSASGLASGNGFTFVKLDPMANWGKIEPGPPLTTFTGPYGPGPNWNQGVQPSDPAFHFDSQGNSDYGPAVLPPPPAAPNLLPPPVDPAGSAMDYWMGGGN